MTPKHTPVERSGAAATEQPRLEALHPLTMPPGHILTRLPVPGLILAAAALGLLAFFSSGAEPRAAASYLVAFLYFLTLALGALFFVLLHFLTRAGWSVVVRRIAEHYMATLPLFLLLVLPLLFWGGHLYHWMEPGAPSHDRLLEHKEPYLNPGFFYLRALFYVGCWGLIGWWFRRGSVRQDETGDITITARLQARSAPAMIVFGITITFASFDWIMSLDPHWYSTIFGVYFFAGIVVSAFALLIATLLLLQRRGILTGTVTTAHFHDLGKLLFAFVVFWAYIAFSQFMLIWYANLPEETIWYFHRLEHGWQYLTLFLVLGHFAIPFFFLLSREVKRSPLGLAAASLWMLALHYCDLYWLVMPAVYPEGFSPHLLDLLAWIGVGSLFAAAFSWLLRGPALIPQRDPRLKESLSFENM